MPSGTLIEWNPFESNKEVDSYPSPPTGVNLMGTDDRGRDILTRLLYGLRYSITFAFLVWVITFIVGTVLGGIMGYIGGRVDFWGQRVVEVLSTVPQFFLLIIIISIFKPSLILLVMLSSIFGWITISYYVRGEFLKNRKKEFVEAARALEQVIPESFSSTSCLIHCLPLLLFLPLLLPEIL